MSKLRELRQKANEHVAKASQIRAENDELTAEQKEQIEDHLDEYTALKSQIDEREEQREQDRQRMERLESALEDVNEGEEVRVGGRAFADEDGGDDYRDLSPEDRRALWLPADDPDGMPLRDKREFPQFRAMEKYARQGFAALDEEEKTFVRESRAGNQTVGTSGQGGITVDEELFGSIREAMKDFGGIRRSRATVITTRSGGDIRVPTVDDTGNTGAWTSEASTAAGGSTHVPFEQITLGAHKVTSGPILVSFELLDDSAFDIVGLVRRKLSERIGRTMESAFAGSTASGQPTGVKSASTGAVVVNYSASSTNFTIDSLRNLKHSVDPAYRRLGGEWMFSDDTLKEVALLKDSDGRPLLEPNLQSADAQRIMGHPYIINQDFDDFGSSGNKPIGFGDFSAYHIRDVREMRLLRLNERYADQGSVGFLAWMRTDGDTASATTDPAQKPIRFILQST